MESEVFLSVFAAAWLANLLFFIPVFGLFMLHQIEKRGGWHQGIALMIIIPLLITASIGWVIAP